MKNRFNSHGSSVTGPITDGFAITPDDTGSLTEVTRAIYVGQTGNLRVETMEEADLTFENIPGGTMLALRVRRVLSSGTTASALLGLV